METETRETVPGYDYVEYVLAGDERGVFWTLFEEDENPYSGTYREWVDVWEEGPFPTREDALADLLEYLHRSPRYNP